MPRNLSYKQVISLAIEDEEMIAYVEEALLNHKNWGQFTMRIPSFVLVSLIDRLKELAEQSLGDKIPVNVDKEDFSDDEEEAPF